MDQKNFINSIARGFSVIRAFGKGREAMTLSEVAELTGLTRATARRILLTLEELEYVTQDRKRFRLTGKVLDLGYAFLSSNRLLEIAQAHLQSAGQRSSEDASMAVLSGTEIIYNARVPNARLISSSISIGTRLPAFATALGRVLLSFMDGEKITQILSETDLKRYTPETITQATELKKLLNQVRKNGYAVVKNELQMGLSAVSVPIYDRDGHVIAAISFDGPTSEFEDESQCDRFLAILLETSRGITQDLPA